MNEFNYSSPVRVIFGIGVLDTVGSELHRFCKRVLICCSKGPFRENGTYERLQKSLVRAGIEVFEMQDIDPNPRLTSVNEGAGICRVNNIDCVVGIGGGSALDCAKVISASSASGIDAADFITDTNGFRKITSTIPTVMIPTLASTGTEVNNYAMIKFDDTGKKVCFTGESAFPALAFLDPELYATAPLKLSLWGIMDIFSHTFEFYFNGNKEEGFQARLSEAILLSLMESTERLMANPADIHARGELMWLAIMAWGGLTKIGRGAPDMTCHAIESRLNSVLDTHHGAGLAVLMSSWMEMVAMDAPEAFARFGRNVFKISVSNDIEASSRAVALFRDWLQEMGAPRSFNDICEAPVTKADIDRVIDLLKKDGVKSLGRLRPLSIDEINALLLKCIG